MFENDVGICRAARRDFKIVLRNVEGAREGGEEGPTLLLCLTSTRLQGKKKKKKEKRQGMDAFLAWILFWRGEKRRRKEGEKTASTAGPHRRLNSWQGKTVQRDLFATFLKRIC